MNCKFNAKATAQNSLQMERGVTSSKYFAFDCLIRDDKSTDNKIRVNWQTKII